VSNLDSGSKDTEMK